MRVLLERSRSACVTALLVAIGTVAVFAHGAAADDDLGIRRLTLWPEEAPPVEAVAVAAPARPRHRHARRIWAASRSRPLRSARAKHGRAAAKHRRAARPMRALAAHPIADAPVVFARFAVQPKPARSALVSIYQDRTLRAGDAVMMADGVHVFRGGARWPYVSGDFARLTTVARLDWHLRQSLDVLDRNPPAHWILSESAAG